MKIQGFQWLASAALALAVVGNFGCAVGPDYQRPGVDTPTAFRGPTLPSAEEGSTNTFADLRWWKVFGDPQLTSLITEALTNNWDLRIAAARVMEAEAILRIRRSEFFPSVNAGGDLVTSRSSQRGPGAVPGRDPQVEYGDVFLSMPAYEIDLWGRIRRANEAARARLLATVEAEYTVRQTLVAQVAAAYFDLLELDLEYEIAQRAYDGRRTSLELTRSREEGGVAGMQDVYQARILVSSAHASLVDISRRRDQQENFLSSLLGRNPGAIPRGVPLVEQLLKVEVPAGLPSTLLERRPDLRSAEQQVVAANADIGEAKAAFYPQVTLTGFFGYQSVALSDLFTGAARTWQFGPAVTMPLFAGGRLRGNLKAAQARFELSLAQYRQAVQLAFRDVSDALIAYERVREFRLRQEERTEAHRGATSLAGERYEGGVTSYLEVLYNEQELLSAELNLAQARRDELLTVVSLYRALGGGWQSDLDSNLTTNP